MVRPEAQGPGQCLLPQVERLTRNAVNQIEADVVEAGGKGILDRIDGLSPAVTAAQKAEDSVIEGLDADVEAVDPQTAEGTR